MRDVFLEIFGTVFALACFAATRLYTEDSLFLYLALMAGTAAGAVIGAFGGKKLSVFDIGANNVIAKIACHFAVTVIFGPLLLQWALMRWPDMEGAAVASAVGGSLALFGTSILVMVAPAVAAFASSVLNYLRWKIQPNIPPQQQPPIPPENPPS